MLLEQLMAQYQGNQPNKFNEEVIYGLRENDHMIDYLEDVCKALEAIPYIKYDGYEMITDENQFREMETISITDSRLDLIIFKFIVKFKDVTTKVSMPLFIPKWINKYYFVLNGNKYYPIYQNVESSTYNSKDSVTLKSLLMPIILKMKKGKLVDFDGNEYEGRVYLLNLFEHKSNFLYYFFATLGYKETIKFFGYEKDIRISVLEPEDFSKFILFPINKQTHIIVNKKRFNEDNLFRYFIFNLSDMFNKKTPINRINDKEYWMTKLGSIFTKNSNNQRNKAETVILSFKRILDSRTRKNLLIDEDDKKDIFHLIKWMMTNYDSLMKKDNLSLLNKRLRLCEYIITPFVRKMSNNTYRILNSKTLNINKIKGILKPNPMTIISELQNSKLLRFNNATNDMDLFNCVLKYSNRGPSAIGEGSKKTVSIIYRGIHPSHLGRLSLSSTSSSDPGDSQEFSCHILSGLKYNSLIAE